MRSNYKKISDYIRLVDNRNRDLKVTLLLGLSISKEFIPSVANTTGTDMSKYKIIRKGQFACSIMQVRRDKKMPLALLRDFDEAIISQAYPVFEVVDESLLLPEYLMMWFSRSEFDRHACFLAVGGVRGSLEWDDFLDMELPIPSIQKQQEIVKEYNTIVNRIALNEQLNQKLEETAQAIYKQWFVDFEFPVNKVGVTLSGVEGYKSSGGKMVWCEELEKEIPEGWEVGVIGDLFKFQRGHDLPSQNRVEGNYPIFSSSGFSGFHEEFKIQKPTIITGRSGSLGQLIYYDKPCWPLNTTLYIVEFKKATPFYSLYFLQTVNLNELGAGSAVPTLNRNEIHILPNELPEKSIMKSFDKKICLIQEHMNNLKKEKEILEELNGLILAKMTKVEIENEMVNG